MSRSRSFVASLWLCCVAVASADASDRSIVLVAGEVTQVDTLGHHDYLAGCACLEQLLRQTTGVRVHRVNGGWPADERVLQQAASIVFYTDGGGKQAYLETPERIAQMQTLVDAGIGLVMIHQAVDFPKALAPQGLQWLGGVYVPGESGRGHWPSIHVDFPQHDITRGVTSWEIKDGWLNGLKFVDGMNGVTPLVWSGKEFRESRAGLDRDIVAWAYERPGGGRSFAFTGLDAHSAWGLPGMRQLVINGVLWSAGVDVPATGAPCNIQPDQLDQMQTPRSPKPKPAAKGGTKPSSSGVD